MKSSVFGLWVAVTDTDDPAKGRPVFRIEYERRPSDKPRAHVHFHAESAELAWIYGATRLKLPRSAEIHYPAGGTRFRPILEDVIGFLDREGLFRNWLLTIGKITSQRADKSSRSARLGPRCERFLKMRLKSWANSGT